MLLAVNLKIPLSPPSLPVTPVLISINHPQHKPLPQIVIINAEPSDNPDDPIIIPQPETIEQPSKSKTAGTN